MAEHNETALSDARPGDLTVHDAADVLEPLFSESDKEQSRETPPAKKSAAAKPQKKAEPAEEEDEPEPKGDEPDPDEQSDDEPESEQDDEETDDDTPEPRTRRIKVDGEEIEVTEEELEKGYSRQADYTRKTQELAKQRQTQEAEFNAVRVERQKYAAALGDIEAALKASTPAEPDWDKLAREYPDDFPKVWAQWQIHKQRLDAVAAERKKADEKVAEDLRQQRQSHFAQERDRLIEAVPTWKDENVRKADKAKLVGYVTKMGYSEDDLKNVTDHRVLVMAHKARLYDESQAKRPAVQQKIEKIKTATPGPSPSNKRQTTDATKARQRLAKTGNVGDAARAIEFILDD